jgi:hypothetical protein
MIETVVTLVNVERARLRWPHRHGKRQPRADLGGAGAPLGFAGNDGVDLRAKLGDTIGARLGL